MADPAALVLAAHGTRSSAGLATLDALVQAVASARPEVAVSVGFVDVATPSLAQALDAVEPPVVVVPVLLSAGFHVRTDIPATVAGRPGVQVTRHLGPDPLIIEALHDRLLAARASLAPATTLLARVGSSRAEAGFEYDAARARLSMRLGRAVASMPPAGAVRLGLGDLPGPIEISTYLLAEGTFLDGLRRDAEGLAVVAEPIGGHPALVELVLARYDEVGSDEVG